MQRDAQSAHLADCIVCLHAVQVRDALARLKQCAEKCANRNRFYKLLFAREIRDNLHAAYTQLQVAMSALQLEVHLHSVDEFGAQFVSAAGNIVCSDNSFAMQVLDILVTYHQVNLR